MKQRTFGPTGARVSVIGQGTWLFEKDRAAAVRALRRGLDLGMGHVDTAEYYGDGAVEEVVGEAIRGRRDEVFLASKVMPQNATRRGTVEACERSLRRLGTERLDLYMLHWPGSVPLKETIEAFEELVERGLVRFWGLSNFNADELSKASEIAGGRRIACNQVLYHLGERAVEHFVIPRCRELGIAMVGYSPFGSGNFPEPDTAGGRVLLGIAEAHGASARQVALAFLTRSPGTFAIPKAAKEVHVKDNAAAAELELSREEVRRIEEAFPLGKPRRDLPMI